MIRERSTLHNSTYPKGGVSYSKDSLAVNHTLVFKSSFVVKSRPSGCCKPLAAISDQLLKDYESNLLRILLGIFIQTEVMFYIECFLISSSPPIQKCHFSSARKQIYIKRLSVLKFTPAQK
jgi:hypothetical protein